MVSYRGFDNVKLRLAGLVKDEPEPQPQPEPEPQPEPRPAPAHGYTPLMELDAEQHAPQDGMIQTAGSDPQVFRLQNGATHATDGVPRYVLPGSSSDRLVSTGAGALFRGASSVTILMWMRPQAPKGDKGIFTTSMLGTDAGTNEFWLRFDAAGFNSGGANLMRTFFSMRSGHETATGTAPAAGEWSQVGLRFDGAAGNGRAILNGAFAAIAAGQNGGAPSVVWNGPDRLSLGDGAIPGETRITADIALARVYRQALTEAEVAQEYEADRVRFGL